MHREFGSKKKIWGSTPSPRENGHARITNYIIFLGYCKCENTRGVYLVHNISYNSKYLKNPLNIKFVYKNEYYIIVDYNYT